MADCKHGGNEDSYATQDQEGHHINGQFYDRTGCLRCDGMDGTTTSKKYGGLVPKKKPLISKDNERAFFDSADWALCKQGAEVNQKSKVAIETLRPKLQRTPHQQLPPRRPACTSGRDNVQAQ